MEEKPIDERLQQLMTAYADLWAHYHALIRAIGASGLINDGRLAVDAQIVMEREGESLAEKGRRRLKLLLEDKAGPRSQSQSAS